MTIDNRPRLAALGLGALVLAWSGLIAVVAAAGAAVRPPKPGRR